MGRSRLFGRFDGGGLVRQGRRLRRERAGWRTDTVVGMIVDALKVLAGGASVVVSVWLLRRFRFKPEGFEVPGEHRRQGGAVVGDDEPAERLR